MTSLRTPGVPKPRKEQYSFSRYRPRLAPLLLVLGVGVSTAAVEVSTAGDFMMASPVTVLAGHSVWEGTQ
jgi:hypothetical protein